MDKSDTLRQALHCLRVCRGEALFLCSSSKREAIEYGSRRELAHYLEENLVTPEEIGSSWEELQTLLQGLLN